MDLVSERVITTKHYPDALAIHCEPKVVVGPNYEALVRVYKTITLNKNVDPDSPWSHISIWWTLGQLIQAQP